MKKNILYFTFIFILLFITALNQTACTQTEVEDNEASTQTTVESDEASVSSESPPELDYSEMNALIDKVIFQKLNAFFRFIKKYLLIAWAFFLSLPPLIKNLIIILSIPASIGIIASHVIGIYKNRNKWEKHPYYNIMYSYFTKSGTLQRQESYKEAHALLRDHTWSWVSFAGLGFRLGNYANKSIMLMFVMSFVYIPLTIFGFIEMTLRFIFGTVWLMACNILHSLMFFVTKLITYTFIPVSHLMDNIIQNTQHCPHCYETFNLPKFICPSCGRKHERLAPGNCGVLFTRCACNKIFLPCASFTGRSRLESECPACAGKLAAANARHFSIVVIGGNQAGKTAFIASLSNMHTAIAKHKHSLTIEGKPDNYFNELNDMFRRGITTADTEPRTYSLIYKHGKNEKDNLAVYDTRDENIVSGTFPRSPKYFRFCDGIILILDPLSVQTVQDEFLKDENSLGNYSPDDTNMLVVQFIHQYNMICGFSTGAMSDIPVAVLINKADVEVVKREIGSTAVKTLYDENPSVYNNNESTAKDEICKAYLAKIGLVNVLHNIEASFTNVSFFPVSAIGHRAEEGKAFTPFGVMEPVAWIAKKRRSRLTGLLSREIYKG